MSGNLFSTSAEKEFKRLTKKNTRANREVPNGVDDDAYLPQASPPPLGRNNSSGANNRIAFVGMVTEVTYDHEEGQMEVAQESLAPEDGEDEGMYSTPVAMHSPGVGIPGSPLGIASPGGERRSVSPSRRADSGILKTPSSGGGVRSPTGITPQENRI